MHLSCAECDAEDCERAQAVIMTENTELRERVAALEASLRGVQDILYLLTCEAFLLARNWIEDCLLNHAEEKDNADLRVWRAMLQATTREASAANLNATLRSLIGNTGRGAEYLRQQPSSRYVPPPSEMIDLVSSLN